MRKLVFDNYQRCPVSLTQETVERINLLNPWRPYTQELIIFSLMTSVLMKAIIIASNKDNRIQSVHVRLHRKHKSSSPPSERGSSCSRGCSCTCLMSFLKSYSKQGESLLLIGQPMHVYRYYFYRQCHNMISKTHTKCQPLICHTVCFPKLKNLT